MIKALIFVGTKKTTSGLNSYTNSYTNSYSNTNDTSY
jgi:hypothetical protein